MRFDFAKAAPIGGEWIQDVIIMINGDVPTTATLPEIERFYRAQASGLAAALYLSLPQGTFDRLIMELMAKKVSLYRGRTE